MQHLVKFDVNFFVSLYELNWVFELNFERCWNLNAERWTKSQIFERWTFELTYFGERQQAWNGVFLNWKKKEIVGFFSINKVPFGWFKIFSSRVLARESSWLEPSQQNSGSARLESRKMGSRRPLVLTFYFSALWVVFLLLQSGWEKPPRRILSIAFALDGSKQAYDMVSVRGSGCCGKWNKRTMMILPLPPFLPPRFLHREIGTTGGGSPSPLAVYVDVPMKVAIFEMPFPTDTNTRTAVPALFNVHCIR